ncbi:MAG: hypothetical protein IPJ76_01575 [Flavobacteriales bacterium]|nr:MAG: hypothetical protein IPJ76_01575 [Flavobacteriales bacterium]
MRRLLFLLTLAVYGFSAMELHEWVRVPQVVLHLLEHHSDLGHHDEETSDHHDHDGDHDPFGKGCHGEFCACSGMIALPTDQRASIVCLLPLTTTLGEAKLPIALGAFAGGVWNPPKA